MPSRLTKLPHKQTIFELPMSSTAAGFNAVSSANNSTYTAILYHSKRKSRNLRALFHNCSFLRHGSHLSHYRLRCFAVTTQAIVAGSRCPSGYCDFLPACRQNALKKPHSRRRITQKCGESAYSEARQPHFFMVYPSCFF